MSVNNYLEPCPFCGGTNLQTDNEYGLVWCDDCFITPRDGNGGIERNTWNRCTPDLRDIFVAKFDSSKLSEEQRKILCTPGSGQIEAVPEHDPMESVVRWTWYNGTPETLPNPDKEVFLCLFRSDNREVHSGSLSIVDGKASWIDLINCHISFVDVGDLWAYLPEPPEPFND